MPASQRRRGAERKQRKEAYVKAYAIAVTAIVLASTVSASSQSEGPYYSNTIHQSVGGRDSRGYP